jgi:hypothetical protein
LLKAVVLVAATAARRQFMLRTTALLVAGLFVVAGSATREVDARDDRPRPVRMCKCVCSSDTSDAENWNTLVVLDASLSCSAENVENCRVYNGKTKEWEDGWAEACIDPPSVQGKPRPPKKRFPRPRRPTDTPTRSPGATP